MHVGFLIKDDIKFQIDRLRFCYDGDFKLIDTLDIYEDSLEEACQKANKNYDELKELFNFRFYRLCIDDRQYMFVPSFFPLVLHKGLSKKKVTVEEAKRLDLMNYWLLDKRNQKRFLEIQEAEVNAPIGVFFKYSQDLEVGDWILNRDNKPQPILKTHTGKDNMFEIAFEDGTSYVVDSKQILRLKDEQTGEEVNMQVDVYLLMDDDFKRRMKFIRMEEGE